MRASLILLLAAVTSLLVCMSAPSDVLIWLTTFLFAATAISIAWSLIRKAVGR